MAEPPEEAREQFLDELWEAVQQASQAGAHPVVITHDDARRAVRCLIDSELAELPVLAESEIRSDIEVMLLPWTEARMAVEFLVVCDRVAQFLTDLAGPSLRKHEPGTFSFSSGSTAVTVEAATVHDDYTVVTVSARPPTEMADAPATFEWLATTSVARGVQILLERHEEGLRPCKLGWRTRTARGSRRPPPGSLPLAARTESPTRSVQWYLDGGIHPIAHYVEEGPRPLP